MHTQSHTYTYTHILRLSNRSILLLIFNMKNNSPLEKALNKPEVVFPMKQEGRTDQSLTVHFEALVSTLRRRN